MNSFLFLYIIRVEYGVLYIINSEILINKILTHETSDGEWEIKWCDPTTSWGRKTTKRFSDYTIPKILIFKTLENFKIYTDFQWEITSSSESLNFVDALICQNTEILKLNSFKLRNIPNDKSTNVIVSIYRQWEREEKLKNLGI